jgi:hypothetical protein
VNEQQPKQTTITKLTEKEVISNKKYEFWLKL